MAKNLFKKTLAWVLTLVLVVLAVPMAAFVASAEEAVVVPTPDASDIGSYINFYQSIATMKEFDTTGSLTTNASVFTFNGDDYAEGGTYFASVKMTFDEYFEWAFVKNEETGKWERGAGNSGIVWGQTGLQFGTYVNGSGQTQAVTLAYRRGQQGFYVMDPGGNPVTASGISGVGQCDVVELTAKYDSVNKTVTVWFNGDNGRVIKTNTIDMSAVNEFQFTGFDFRCGSGGSRPENLDDITNENKVKNNVTFSDLHLWGDVSTTKHYMAPSIGSNTNIANTLTLSDATLDADWKADGEFDWNYANVTFDGLNFKEYFVGKKIYASVTLTNIAKGSGGNDTYGVSFATDGTNIASAYLRPQWNQQGVAGISSTNLISNDGWGVAGNDGSLGSWDGSNEQVFIYEYDVDAKTVDIWRRTSVYQSHHAAVYQAAYQDIYLGKFSVSSDMILGLAIGSKAVASTFNKNVKVSNVQVWTTTEVDSTNVLDNAVALEGGKLDTGIPYNNSTDLGVNNTPVWSVGTTVNNTGIYKSLKQGGYSGKTTVVWKGIEGDLTKGSIVYSADFTVYNKTTGWGGDNWGLIVATVDGHYVSTGFGVHGAAGATYNNWTVVDGSNIGEQAGAQANLLGASGKGGVTVKGTEEGVVVNVTAVLTGTTLTTYIDGVKAQTYDFTGKTVVPQFGIAWGSGNANDTISNVKIFGDGVKTCEHTYDNACDATCNKCDAVREVGDHVYDGACDAACNNCGFAREAGAHTYDNDTDMFCNVCNFERVFFTLLYRAGNLTADFASQIAGSTVATTNALTPSQFATQSLSVGGAKFDYTKGYTVEADFTVTTNPSMESHFGITAITINDVQYTFGMLSNGNWSTSTPTQAYTPYIRKSNSNTLIGATGGSVTATDEGATVNLKVEVTSTGTVFYVNGTQANVITFEEGHVVAPFVGFTSRGAQVTVSNVKVYGDGASNCVDHVYDNTCDVTCNLCGAVSGTVNHVYDNDYDTDCNNCGATRTAPGTVLPEIGDNHNFASDLVFNSADINDMFATGDITWGDMNATANGALLNENGSVVIKTDITFNGNVDYNWSATTDEETGETTYSYKNAWGRTGVKIGTYFWEAQNRTMDVFVTYRRCTGGVYIWDNSQQVNGSGNPVVIGNIAPNKDTLSFVVKYDSAANAVSVWADGAYVGTATLERFGEVTFGLGLTQHGAGTSAVDPEDNTNGETTKNTVTFSNIEVWGNLTATCVHEYDNACDVDCNKCFEVREVAGHNYADADCDTPKTCTVCGATEGEALGHDWADADCDTPKTCNTCGATEGEALGHNYGDATCDAPATCTVCGATTGEALGHDWADADCDTPKTCNTCGAIEGEALGHNYGDATCTAPATCTVCGATTGEALGHDWADATCTAPKTCNTCGATEGEALGHDWADADCDTPKTCNTCGAIEGEALGHNYGDATCDAPATCTVCGATTGEALGHDWADADCDTPKTCNTCGATEGEALGHNYGDATCDDPATCTVCGATTGEALGHDWADADCDTPKTCNTCGATEGEALGHSYDDEYDADCNVCGETREVPSKVVIGDIEIELTPDEELPVDERVDTKYILGWKNPDGSKYEGTTFVPGLVAEFVETKMMTVKYQLGKNEDSIRYIASVDETERYNSVGWLFSLTNENPEKGGAGVVERNSTKVYTGILENGVEKTAAEIYGADYSNYLYVFEISNIPASAADSVIYVRPYVEMEDGTIVYGDVSSESLNGLKNK